MRLIISFYYRSNLPLKSEILSLYKMAVGVFNSEHDFNTRYLPFFYIVNINRDQSLLLLFPCRETTLYIFLSISLYK